MEKLRKILVNICRVVLSVTFIFSGFVKAVDPLGTQYKIADYAIALHINHWLPDFITLFASVVLSAVEFTLGICLLFAIQRRLTTRFILAIMVVLTPFTLWIATANPVSDCGCFGDAVTLTNWQTFWKNVFLLAAAITTALFPKDMMRFISKTNQWIVTNYTILFILATSGWSLYDLPVFDFRPYHIGSDLKDGWTKMINGEDSPYTDLFIESQENGDMTEEILTSKGYTFLLVAHHIEVADDSQLDKINELYEYAQEERIPFYCLTASSKKHIDRWIETTGAEYPFAFTDDIVLKTMIRSNPGLLLIKDGKIIGKWSHNNLPELTENPQPLNKTKEGSMPDDNVAKKMLIIALWYILPLLLLTIADRIWAWTRKIKK